MSVKSLPKDPWRQAIQRAMLEEHRVVEMLHGRDGIELGELAAMLAKKWSISRGLAESAIQRAADDHQVVLLVTIPPSGNGALPAPGAVADQLEDEVARMQREARARGRDSAA